MSFFQALLASGSTQFESPLLINDTPTATSVELFWQDVDADNYVLQQDGVDIYSGSLTEYNATGLTDGVTYSFRVKAEKSGYEDSEWTTISVSIPNFYSTAAIAGTSTSNAATAARQTALEPSNAGVDRAQSWSAWVRFSNTGTPNIPQHAFNCSEASNQQYNLSLIQAESNTISNHLRFILFTTAANFIYIQSATPLEKGPWYHIVITYDGTESVNGLEMYINGVLESSPTRNTTGTYTGCYNNAALRFRISSLDSGRYFTGGMRDLALWNIELDQSKVDELYDTEPVSVPGVSFYGNIIAFYPLTSDVTCSNNATYNLTSAGGITFSSRAVNSSLAPLSFKRTTVGNTRYVAFGGAFVNGSNVMWYGRSGTSHVLGGKIVKIAFNTSTKVAAAPVDAITDGTYDLRGGSAGIVGSKVDVFSSRYNGGTDTFIDSRRYESTDGTTGATFDSGSTVTVNYSRYNFYGEVVTADVNGVTVSAVPFFGHNGSGTWKMSIFRTTDGGANWSKIDIIDGSGQFGEAALTYADGVWLLLAKKSNATIGIHQSYSTDDMATWSSFALTNIVSGEGNCSVSVNSVGRLNIVHMDRSNGNLYISKNNKMSDIISSATSYKTKAQIGKAYSTDSLVILGYPNIVRYSDEDYFIGWSTEFSSSRADQYYSMGKINVPN